MKITPLVLSPLGSNCYVLQANENSSEAVIVDPGDTDVHALLSFVMRHNLNVREIWLTHGHFDHILGVDVVRQALEVPAYLHRADLPLWEQVQQSAQTWLGRQVNALQLPNGYWEDGATVSVGNCHFTVWHTPGHSPGSVCLVGEEAVFTGDTLFAGTIGRTDLPLSNPRAMRESLQRLLTLPDDLQIYPGHGPKSTVIEEKQRNPYFH